MSNEAKLSTGKRAERGDEVMMVGGFLIVPDLGEVVASVAVDRYRRIQTPMPVFLLKTLSTKLRFPSPLHHGLKNATAAEAISTCG
jgi:hypothetical protein